MYHNYKFVLCFFDDIILHVDTDVCKIAVDSGTPEFYVVIFSGFVTSYMMHVASMVLRTLNPKCFIGLSSIFYWSILH